MRNMKPPKGVWRWLALGLIAAFTLAAFTGCPNPLRTPDAPAADADTGTLSLTIAQPPRGRTIMPNVELSHFGAFRLEFTPAGGGETVVETRTAPTGDVTLTVGEWNLAVYAFLNPVPGDLDTALAAASGRSAGSVSVSPAGNATAEVELAPIETGNGTFAWNLAFQGVSAATMTIWPYDYAQLLTGTPLHAIAFFGDNAYGADYEISLPAGRYHVALTLVNDVQPESDRETVVIHEALHVYRNMTSAFDRSFAPMDFPVSMLAAILGRWDGTEWNLAGIDHRHFASLDVLGVTADNYAAVLALFNTPAFAGVTPANLTLAGLRTLVDATLVSIATPAIAGGNHANRGEARTAIAAAAANQTTPALVWNAAGTNVTVTLGVYSLTIEFAHGLSIAWTVSAYPATGQTTALYIEFCCQPDLEADDITITEGTGAVTPGTLTGTRAIRRLAVTTTRWGDVGIAIDGTDQTARVTGRAITAEEIGGEKGGPMIVAGDFHTLAIRGDGTLWAWGLNQFGQLGDGTTMTIRTTPVRVGGNAAQRAWIWAYVSEGNSHSMGIRQDGTLWAWGSNANGQLGDGTTTNRTAPVQIQEGTTWAHVAAGGAHTVGIRTDGTLWAWGNQANGRLGNDETATGNVTSPIQIQEGTRWIYATAGGTAATGHTVGIREDGTLWAWGFNNNGQLGIGPNTGPQTTPIRVGTDLDRRWASVFAFANRTMGIQDDGTLWGWGANPNGSTTGDGTTTARNTPTPVGSEEQRTDPNWVWASVSAGTEHTVGIRQDGTLWAWGLGANGRLGDGMAANRTTPVQVGNTAQREDPDWLWASVGASQVHSAGIRADGTFWAWGNNANGVTGLGLEAGAGSTLIPARVDWTRITGTAAVTGAPWVGQTLTANVAGINPNTGTQGTALVIQWQRGTGTAFTDIPGATGTTYVLQPADVDLTVRAAVSRTGYVFRIFSPATAPIVPEPGDGDFTITMPDFIDGAPPEIAIADISILDTGTGPGGLNQTITAAGFDSVDWFFAHPATGVEQHRTGPSLDLAEVHGNRIGNFRITVEVQAGGNWYSRIITFRVVP